MTTPDTVFLKHCDIAQPKAEAQPPGHNGPGARNENGSPPPPPEEDPNSKPGTQKALPGMEEIAAGVLGADPNGSQKGPGGACPPKEGDDAYWEYAAQKVGERLPLDALKEDIQSAVQAVKDGIKDDLKGESDRPVEVKIEVTLPDKSTLKKTLGKTVHSALQTVLGCVEEGLQNILVVGPTGTGKTVLAGQLAQALDRPFGFQSFSSGVGETHLLGRLMPRPNGEWTHEPTTFIDIYQNGGVFLMDEVDAADPTVMVQLNAALANGQLANPWKTGEVYMRHEDCLIIAAANTWCAGPDANFVGRNALDAATRDRFAMAEVYVDYDHKLEKTIAKGILDNEKAASRICKWAVQVRKDLKKTNARRFCSTRVVENMARAMKTGRTFPELVDRYLVSWGEDDKKKLSPDVKPGGKLVVEAS